MAEKVTLKKPDGTIIYPQTQVDTADIADGAVTSAKLATGIATLTGTGAPTSSTAASVGQFYIDTLTGNTYVCTAASGGTYTWDTVGGGVSLTMTQTDPGEGSALASNTILGVYGGGGVTMDYSTAEQATGYTWINGNMIYSKTVNFGALPNNNSKTVAHGISNLGTLVKMDATTKRTDGVQAMLPFPGITSAPGRYCLLEVNSTNIACYTEYDYSGITECYVTLYYTKSA